MKFVIAVAILSTLALYAEGCDIITFQQCLTEFTDKYPETSDSINPSYSEEELVGVCRDFSQTETCVGSSIIGCSEEVELIWEVLTNVMDYICSDRTKEILGNANNAACINSQVLMADITNCNTTMQAELNRLQLVGNDEDLCSTLKNFASCSVGSVEKRCGQEVASWYGGLVDAALDPSKKVIDCHFTAGATHVGFSTMMLALALLLNYAVGN